MHTKRNTCEQSEVQKITKNVEKTRNIRQKAGSKTESKNWLISYPRSGSNLMRYCIEVLVKKPTFGCPKMLLENNIREDLVLLRGHEFAKHIFEDKQAKIVLLIRNYKELIFRPPQTENANIGITEKTNDVLEKFIVYFDRYRNFEGDKKIIYYEDILFSLTPIKEVLDFFEYNLSGQWDNFVKNEAYHRRRSLGASPEHKSDAKSVLFHQKNIDNKVLDNIDNKFKTELGQNFEFVERYWNSHNRDSK